VYTFKKHEQEALKLALSWAADPGILVDILIPSPSHLSALDSSAADSAPKVYGDEVGHNNDSTNGSLINVENASATSALPRKWYEYLDIVVLFSLIFYVGGGSEESWEASSRDPSPFEHLLNATHREYQTDGEVGSSSTSDLSSSIESFFRLMHEHANIRISQCEDGEDDVWAAALRRETKDLSQQQQRLFLVGQNRKAFLSPERKNILPKQQDRQKALSFEKFADSLSSPLMVVYAPPSAKLIKKQKQFQRRSRRFSLASLSA